MSGINLGNLQTEEDVQIGEINIPLITPKRGIDYWTPSDKQEVITEAIDSVNAIIMPQEQVRQSNEVTRQNNETTRQSNEATRQENEAERIENETAREERFVEIETLVGNLEDDVEEMQAEQVTQNANISANASAIGEINTSINDINQNIDDLEQDLTNYSLITETGSQIELNINSSDFKFKAILKDKNGNTIYTSNIIDLPLETMVVGASYDNTTKEVILTLQNGTTLRFSVADLVSGLVSTDELTQVLSNYYNKTEINNLLANHYTKSETDTLLNEKANQTSLDTTNQNVTNLTGRVSTNETDIADIKEEQTTQNTNIEELQNQVETLQEDLESANSEIEELNTDITNMRKAMYKVDGQGSDITLQNTSENKFVEFGLEGRTEQEQLSGKNLFDNSVINNSWIATNGTITDDSSASSFKYNCSSGDTYTISASFEDTGTSNIIVIAFYDENDGMLSRSVAVGSSNKEITLTKTAPENTAYMYAGHYTKIPTKIQLEKSSVATSFEPYCGGIPSPNPDFPQQIKNVTGNANVKIQNKNLFNLTAQDFKNGSIVGWASLVKLTGLKPNTTYICSTNDTAVLGPETSNLLFGGQISVFHGVNNSNPKTATSSEEGSIGIYIRTTNIDTFFENYWVQIEEGSTATDFVPHQEQNYPFTFAEGQRLMQGTTLEDDGIHNKRTQLNLKDKNWVVRTDYTDTDYVLFKQNDYESDIYKSIAKCTHFPIVSSTPSPAYNCIRLVKTAGYGINILIQKSIASTPEELKTWLTEQNVIVELELEQPEIIPYNATQQAQYNAKKEATSYDDITYITSTSDELGFNMNVVAVADANKVIDSELQEIKNAITVLGGDLNV